MGSKKSSSTQETKRPAWVNQGSQQTFGDAQNWVRNNPTQPYSGAFAAPLSQNQAMAQSLARDRLGAGSNDLDQARALTAQAGYGSYQPIFAPEQQYRQMDAPFASAVRQPDYARLGAAPQVAAERWDAAAANQYMNPYSRAVTDDILSEIDRSQRIERRDVDHGAQAAHAFGGDRHAILMAETMRNQADQRARTAAQLSQSAYENAQGQFERDRGAAMQAALANQGVRAQYDMGNAAAANDWAARNASLEQQTALANQNAALAAAQANLQARMSVEGANADRLMEMQRLNSAIEQQRYNQMLAAGGQMAQIGNQASEHAGRDVQNLLATGLAEQQARQREIEARYADYLRVNSAPLDQYAKLAGILGGLPTDLTVNTKGKTNPGILGTIGGVVGLGSGIVDLVKKIP